MLDVLIIFFLIIGISLIVYASIYLKTDEGIDNKYQVNMENLIKAIDKSASDADNTVDELAKFSEGIVNEIGEKYQELLYLYNLIDEKSTALTSHTIDIVVDEKTDKTKHSTPKKPKQATLSPKYKEIFDLDLKGHEVADIAKILDMGQGEVKLILELGKAR